ncbi:MAG: hypothetical protein QNJ33_07695 [Crocosphaera sp.]|nr:hypothetical protein [Crocosphaera sp.]
MIAQTMPFAALSFYGADIQGFSLSSNPEQLHCSCASLSYFQNDVVSVIEEV